MLVGVLQRHRAPGEQASSGLVHTGLSFMTSWSRVSLQTALQVVILIPKLQVRTLRLSTHPQPKVEQLDGSTVPWATVTLPCAQGQDADCPHTVASW